MKNKTLLFGIIYLSLTSLCIGQTYFQKIFGTIGTDKSFGVLSVNGGYVLSGHANNDLLLLKVDNFGNTVWKKTYGGVTQTEEGKVCVKTADGGFLITGYSQLGAGLFDAILTKTDSLGNFQWSKTYGDSQHNKAWPVDINAAGAIYIAGWSEATPNTAPASAFIIKTNSNGDTIWTRKFGTSGKNYFRTLDATNDGGCIAVGETDNYGSGGFDILAVKLNSSGDTLWTRTFGSTGDDYGWSVKQTNDNGYVIVGNTGSFGYTTNLGDAIIIKLTSSGNIQWVKTIGDASTANTLDGGRSVTQTQDGNIIFCGYSGVPGPSGNEQGWVAKLNITNGDTLWTRFYPVGTSNEHFRYISEVSGGEYIVSGYTSSLGAGNDDVFLMRLKDGGFAGGCNQSGAPANFAYNSQTVATKSGIPYLHTTFITNSVTGNYNPTLTETMLCDSTLITSIIESNLSEKSSFKVYPNPGIETLTVAFSKAIINNGQIKIFNSFGVLVKEISIVSLTEINIADLQSGLYFIQLNSDPQQTIKFIKR